MTQRRVVDVEGARGDLPRNFLRPCILLLLKEKESHGYALLERLAEFKLPHDDPGGLYRVLRQLEGEGLVRSWWETSPTGPARRTYTITEEGERWLQGHAQLLEETRWIVIRFLERYRQAVGSPAKVVRMSGDAGR